MNKTAIKNFAVWARNELIADVIFQAGLTGITESGIAPELSQSTSTVKFYDIGTKDPVSVSGDKIQMRQRLVEAIREKEKESDYPTAFRFVVEKVAYTWFNRLIAIRFMEVNDYLPGRVRVLSSENQMKSEPDIVTNPFDSDLEFTQQERQSILQMKDENHLDELFRFLFIRQCHQLHEALPVLFDSGNELNRKDSYLDMLLTISYTDKDGVLWKLIHDIPEDDFNVEKEGQIEIIGWMYQYYNTEPKDQVFANLKRNIKINKDNIPAATQLFTPDWIVRYMVENSLGRLWVEGHPNEDLKKNWKYYLEEAEQEPDVQAQLTEIRKEYAALQPEEIKVIDPCSGSGHILVYLFEVLMQIYESQGWPQREAAQSIVQNNLYGLDIDDRAAQLAYLAVMMKARQYDRRFLERGIIPHVFGIQESNGINREQIKLFGKGMSALEKNNAFNQLNEMLDALLDAKEYGSILNVPELDWDLLSRYLSAVEDISQITIDTVGAEETLAVVKTLLEQAKIMSMAFDVIVTNPPYMGNGSMGSHLCDYAKKKYKNYSGDLYAIFMKRNLDWVRKAGYVSMITQHTWMFTSSYEEMRKDILANSHVKNLIHLGAHAFDEINGEVVQTATFVLQNIHIKRLTETYVRLTNYGNQSSKEKAFLDHESGTVFLTSEENFQCISGHSIAYWASPQVCKIYREEMRVSDYGTPKQGLATGANDQFLRAWFEIEKSRICFNATNLEDANSSGKKWFPYNKGGENKKWYGNNFYVVNWEKDGYEIKHFTDAKGKLRSRPQNLQYFFKPCCTWSLTSSGDFGARLKEPGFIFDINGMSLFTEDSIRLYMLGYLCSTVCVEFMKIGNPSLASQSGDIAKLPFIVDESKVQDVSTLVEANCNDAKEEFDEHELSWNYKRNPLV